MRIFQISNTLQTKPLKWYLCRNFIFKIILMKSSKITVIFLLLVATVFGQQKITVENIYSGVFRAKGMDELQSLKNTDQYTVLNVDQASRSMQIDLYDFATLKKVSNLIDTKNHKELEDGNQKASLRI